MDRWEAQYKFWSQFGIPAYEENSVPDLDEIDYPYITFQAAAGGFDELIPITASIWDRNSSTAVTDNLADIIEHKIRTSGPFDYDKGKIRVYIGDTTFAQNLGDPDDKLIKRKVLNVIFEFMEIIF